MVGQTIVANASEHYIWVLMDADRKYTTEKNEKLATRLEESNAKERAAKVAASGGFKTIWNASVEVDGSSKDQNSRSDFSEDAKDLKQEMHHIAYSTGFSRILPGKYLKFKTEGEPHVSLVWITIHVEKIDGSNYYSFFKHV
uniref:Uncharacterized protein n=1 Tax=Panagrolaimus superbus TaxID=310955 RepID=A0A914Z8U1_9BILA